MRIIAHAKPAFWLVWIQVNDGRIQWSFWVTCPAFPGSQWPEAGVSSSVCKSKKSIFFPLLHFILSFQWMQWRNYTVKNVIMSYLPATAKYNWSKNWNEKSRKSLTEYIAFDVESLIFCPTECSINFDEIAYNYCAALFVRIFLNLVEDFIYRGLKF